MSFLTQRFFDIISKINFNRIGADGFSHTNQVYNSALNSKIHPSPTHCGTVELSLIHEIAYEKNTIERVAELIACSVLRTQKANYVYYCPEQEKYMKVVNEILIPLGFKKALEFTHLGYLWRDPDHGHSFMYSLLISAKEFDKINEIANGSNHKGSLPQP